MSGKRTPSTLPEKRLARHQQRDLLNHKMVRTFDDTRCLPTDMPSVRGGGRTDKWATVSPGTFDLCERWLDRTGLVNEIELRLHAHPTTPSRLTIKALLMGMILSVYVWHRYWRTDICATLCGLDARHAYRLGLFDPEKGRVPFDYCMVQTQLRRLEDALYDGWEVPADERSTQRVQRNLMWFSQTAIDHSIPDDYKPLITAVAEDSTAVATWARDQVTGEEKQLQEALKKNPPPPTPAGENPAIGSIGIYGRVRRTTCPHALPAYTADGIETGYDAHMVTNVRDVSWGGNPRRIRVGEPVVPYILSVVVMPGQVKYADSGVQALAMARNNAPNAARVIADMGYSQSPRFLTGSRQIGYSPDFDYKSERGGKGRPNQIVHQVRIGSTDGGEFVLMNDGVILPLWTPPEFQAPPTDLSSKALAAWRAERHRLFAWVCIQQLPDGSRRMQCPQCAGKIRTTARTRSKAAKAQPRQLKRRTRSTPGPKPRPIPRIKIDDNYEYCCGGVRTIHPESATDKIVQYQDIPHGTPAWKTWYSYRNPSETTNSRAKMKNLLQNGWCRALGLAATTIGAVLVGVALNLDAPQKNRRSETHSDSPEAQLAAAVDRSPTVTQTGEQSGYDDDRTQQQDGADTPRRADVAEVADSRSPP